MLMHVVVTYESRSGNTKAAAQLIAGGLQASGGVVTLTPVDRPDFGALAQADLIVVGTWTDGFFFFGQRPGMAGKIAGNLPDIWDKPVYSFVTYAKNPGQSHVKLGEMLEAKGAFSIGASAIHRNELEAGASAVVDAIVEQYAAS